MEPDELLSLSQVGRRLKKDRATVRRWVERGRLHGTRVGQRTYIRVDELDRFLREGAS
jgi:excisionase family DNA binding protein